MWGAEPPIFRLTGPSAAHTDGRAGCTNVQVATGPRSIVDRPADERFTVCFTRETIDVSGQRDGKFHHVSDPTEADRSGIGWDPDLAVSSAIEKIETADGELDLRELGIWDKTNKNCAGAATVEGSTGRFKAATGSLTSIGNGDGNGLASGTIYLE